MKRLLTSVPWRSALAKGARVALLAIALAPGSLRPAPADGPLEELDLGVGFTRTCFTNVNRHDAELAFRAFMATVGRHRGFRIAERVLVFDDAAAFEAAIKAGIIQLAILDAWQFLTMDLRGQMEPCFVPTERGRVGKRYLLLTRKDSGLDTLASLRGRGLTKLEVANSNLGRHWLETVLLADNLGAPEDFFGLVESVAKPTAAVLPVFFGRKACCLLDRITYDVICELNPQVGLQLQVVAESEPFLDIVLCLAESGWKSPHGREETHAALGELAENVAGEQILTLFKIGPLVPFSELQLDEVRALRDRHQRLRGQRAGREVEP